MVSVSRVWELFPQDPEKARSLARRAGISPVTAQVLINRKIETAEGALRFLNPVLSDLYDPWLLPDIRPAVDRIRDAIRKRERITVYGDYDVDGLTAAALLVGGLKQLGAAVSYYIPDRLSEGYGLNSRALETIAASGCDLVISVDCGVGAVEEARVASECGLDLIITDHHEPSDITPGALAVVDPKRRDSEYPFRELAGVGVAFKILQAIFASEGLGDEDAAEYLDLVAVGTVADVAPLNGENRVLVKYGLDRLGKSHNLGLRALIEVLGLEGRQITSGQIGFILAPRLNAAGRIANAVPALELLLTRDQVLAQKLALQLDEDNRRRQDIEQAILEQALKLVDSECDLGSDMGIVVGSEGWHPGVIGIVASRICEMTGRPTVLVAFDGEHGKGSCRSVPSFNMYGALRRCEAHLDAFGGHEMAAGLSLERDRYEDFRQAFLAVCNDHLSPQDLVQRSMADARVAVSDIDLPLVEELSRLSPFGQTNPEPVLWIDAQVVQARGVGRDGTHLKLKLKDLEGHQVIDAIGFGKSDEYLALCTEGRRISALLTAKINDWNGTKTPECFIREIAEYAESSRIEIAATQASSLSRRSGGSDPAIKIADRRGIEDPEDYVRELLGSSRSLTIITRQPERYASVLDLDEPEVSGGRAGVFGVFAPDISNRFDGGVHHIVVVDLPPEDFLASQILRGAESAEETRLHLLFGRDSLQRISRWGRLTYPDRDVLAQVYLAIEAACPNGLIDRRAPELVSEVSNRLKRAGLYDGDTASEHEQRVRELIELSLQVFREIGLVDDTLRLLPRPSVKLDLTVSLRYNDVVRSRARFTRYLGLMERGSYGELRNFFAMYCGRDCGGSA